MEVKGIIVYKSKYGSTKQYAQWIKEETGFKMRSVKEVTENDLKDADVIVLGSYIFNYKPSITPWIKKNWNLLKDKKIILYATSGSIAAKDTLRKGFSKAFPTKIRSAITLFPFGGRMLYNKLTWIDKLIMKVVVLMEKHPTEKARLKKDINNVKKEEINELIKAI